MIETKRLRDTRIFGDRLRALGQEANKSYAFIERGWYFTKRYWAWEAVWVVYNIVNALAVTFIAATASLIPGATIPPDCAQPVHPLPSHRHGDLDVHLGRLR